MHKRRFHSQNAGFEMSAPIGIGVEISAGGDVSLNRRSLAFMTEELASIPEPTISCGLQATYMTETADLKGQHVFQSPWPPAVTPLFIKRWN
jgi:hypothetical protein